MRRWARREDEEMGEETRRRDGRRRENIGAGTAERTYALAA